MSISTLRRPSPSNRRQRSGQANGREPGAGSRARIAGPSERCRADQIVAREGLRSGSNGTRRHAARPRHRPRLSAGANMSRLCAPKSPLTPRARASVSSAARPTTARGERSRSSACHELSKRRTRPPRPKRGRNAADVRTQASAADAHLSQAAPPAIAIPSGLSECARPPGVSGRRVRTIRTLGIGLSDQTLRGVTTGRASVASIGLKEGVTAIAANARRERGTARIRRANASLTGPRAGRHVRTIGNPGVGLSGQMLQGVVADRRKAASIAPQRKVTAIVEIARSERGTAPIRRANASLTGPKAGRVPQRAKADRRVQRPRAALARISNQDRRAQGDVTGTGRGAPAVGRAAKADRRVAAPRPSGALARRGRARRTAARARAGHRESRDRCGSSAADSRAARC
jgi:hypothetical protein